VKRRPVLPLADHELLLRAALIPDERAVVAWRELRPKLEITTLDGNITPLVPRLRANLLGLGVEDELMPVFKGVHRHAWAQNQLLVAAMMPVVAELERRGIATLLLKGAAVLAAAQRDQGFRRLADVDVLVPVALRRAAIDALLEIGLEPHLGVPAWYVDELVSRYSPSYAFIDADGRELDLHWHALHASRQPEADADFWDAALPAVLGGIASRTLCDSDSLLHAVLHGLADNGESGFRWALDVALTIEDARDLDWDRLVEQSRRRRVSWTVGAGLSYVRELLDVPIPQSALRELRRSGPRVLERLELRAKRRAPDQWGALDRTVIYYQQYARAELPLGPRPGLCRELRAARACFGIERLRPTPGPFRPPARAHAALGGHGEGAELELGEALALGDAELVRALVRYGAWLPEAQGVWLAGREAQLELALDRPPSGSLLLALDGENYLADVIGQARLRASVNGRNLAELRVGPGHPRLAGEQIAIPAALTAGRRRLSITLRMPDAVAPARIGRSEDDRVLGFFLRELIVREPLVLEPGTALSFAAGGEGARAILGGWSSQEPAGRWTDAREAGLLLAVRADGDLELTLDAEPFVPGPGARQRVEILAGGTRIAALALGAGERPPRVRVPHASFAPAGELHLRLRLPDASSPYAAGLAEDRRALGLLVRALRLSSPSSAAAIVSRSAALE
jgi:hypothetical protein